MIDRYVWDMIVIIMIGMVAGHALATTMTLLRAMNTHRYQLTARQIQELRPELTHEQRALLDDVIECWPGYTSQCDRALSAELELSGLMIRSAHIVLWDRSRELYFGDYYRICTIQIAPELARRFAGQNALLELD
jgi:hypothetical protein